MNDREKLVADETEWRRLCALVANEHNPQRMSDLLGQLFKELDARRQAERENENANTPSGDF